MMTSDHPHHHRWSPDSQATHRLITLVRLFMLVSLTLFSSQLLGNAPKVALAALSFPVSETFSGSAPDLGTGAGSGWVFSGSAQMPGDGWLQLTTSDAVIQSGTALLDNAFSTGLSTVVEFDYAAYGGGTPGDGFSFFLIDGAYTTGPGYGGGALGYACFGGPPCTNAGVSHGYVGIGFDEYGNNSIAIIGNGGPGYAPNHVVIRGSGDGTSGYAYLTGVTPSGTIDTGSRAGFRRVRVSIINQKISVEMTPPGGLIAGPYAAVISNYDLAAASGQAVLPATLKLGFSAGTASASNYHLIRNVVSNVPADLAISMSQPPTTLPGNPISYTLVASNTGANEAAGAVVADTVPAGIDNVTWTCTASGGAACGAASGTGNSVSVTASVLPAGGALTITVSGTVASSAGGTTVVNTASVTPPVSRTETNNANDIASASTLVLATGTPMPGGVTTPVMWVRSDNGAYTTGTTPATDGQPVVTWDNPDGNDPANATSGQQPTFRSDTANLINFQPVLDFDGTNDHLVLSGGLLGNGTVRDQMYTFAVGISKGPAGAFLFESDVAGDPNANGGGYRMSMNLTPTGAGMEFGGYASGGLGLSVINGNGTTPYITTFGVHAGSTLPGTPDSMAIWRNGAFIGGNGNGVPLTGQNMDLGIGSVSNGSYPGGHLTSEIVTYLSQNLTVADRNRVESYLALKYGITLSQTTPQNYTASDGTIITWDAAANAAYKNNITGIGRDDATALNQKQSKSINPGALVTMGLGGVAANNASNTSSFSADKSFLTFGDDNGATSWQTTGVPTGLQRLTRVWKMQTTGTIGDVTLQVPDSDSSLATKLPPAVGTIFVLVDADGDFSNGATLTTMTLNGSTWQASTDLSAGTFFTFATPMPALPGGVTGSAMWLRADNGPGSTTNGAGVSYWGDVSGSGHTVFADTTPPVFQDGSSADFNSNPGLLFAATNMNRANLLASNADGTVMWVSHIGAGSLAGYADSIAFGPTAAGSTGDNPEFGTNANNVRGFTPTPSTIASGSVALAADTSYIGGASWLNANPASTDLFTNGTTDAVTLDVNSIGPKVWVGGDGGSQSAPDGDYAEFVVFPTKLSASDVNKVQSYLATKYGITLGTVTTPVNYAASDNTVFWTGDTTYQHDVTVIGRDDTSALEQKQSKSVNAGAPVMLGLGDIAADNASNSGSFTADKSFFAIGDNNGDATLSTPIGSGMRMGRVWRVQETGTVDNVRLRVPASIFASAVNARILFSTDPTFATYTVTPLTCDVTNCDVNTDLATGQFFTFAAGPQKIRVAPPIFAAGDQETGTTSVATTITITNTGLDPLSVSDLALAGANKNVFAITGGTCGTSFPISLASTLACTVTLTFTPDTTGAKSASLIITSDDPDAPVISIPLLGTGVDTIPPAAPIITGPVDNTVTSDTSPVISGTAEPGSVVAVLEGTRTLCTAVTDASGTWTCTPATLTPGKHTISATATDADGNTSAESTAVSFTINAPVPIVAITSPARTEHHTPTLSGTADANSIVTVQLDLNKDGVTDVVYTTTADAAGTWSIDTGTATPSSGTFPANGLALGTRIQVTATATNVTNTSSAAAVQEVTIVMLLYVPAVYPFGDIPLQTTCNACQ